MKYRPIAAMIAALTLASGCDTLDGLMVNVSTTGQVSPHYQESYYPFAALDRDMWVVVIGAVPGREASALQQQTLATMQRHAGINTRFTATPQNHRPEFKTVILFNGPLTTHGAALCRNPQQPNMAPPAAGSELRLQAVFCRYDEPLSELSGRVGGGNSLSNPHFNALIRQTMTDLYRAAREQQRNEPEGE